MTLSRQFLFILLSLFLLFLIIELMSLAFLQWHVKPQGLLYQPQKLIDMFDENNYRAYYQSRDPLLGWPSPQWAGKPNRARRQDSSGARFSPAFPTPGQACVSLYGDSFVWSDEVDDAAAWGNVLAQKLDCRVANYGYGGYGTDQAYLRFRDVKTDDEAPIVILGHLTGDIIRNVNQWRVFLYMPSHPKEWRNFKPRFTLDDNGRLSLVPLPDFEFNELPNVAHAPTAFFQDFFVPGAPAGPVNMRFPWSLTVARAYQAYFQRHGLDAQSLGHKRQWLKSYYQPGHASGAFEITTQILVEFVETARQRSKQPIIFLLPAGAEVIHFQATGTWFSQPLAEAVNTQIDATVVHIGEHMAQRVPADELCELFIRPNCKGHYNVQGYAHVADIAYNLLQHVQPALTTSQNP